MQIGDTYEYKNVVTKEITAGALGSGGLDIFATPFLICWMEAAAYYYMKEQLPEGKSSVGTMVNVRHVSPSPIGAEITAKAELIAMAAKANEEHAHEDEEEEHEHHHHHDHENGVCSCGHHHDHDDDDDDEDEHEHEHHHHDHDEHDHDDHCCCGHHHDHDEDDDEHEHEHHHHDHDEHDHEHGDHCCCGHHHHDHHADEVFTSWGVETARKFTKAEVEHALTELDTGNYGMILRSKGIVDGGADGWLEFDYVPGEWEVRARGADVGGKLVVIGSKLNETAIAQLFGC